MTLPRIEDIKIYHIIHLDKLQHVINAKELLCDKIISSSQSNLGTMIGMKKLKNRRMTELKLSSHSQLYVGDCVPFYFCPRSVMLYVIHKANNNLDIEYKNGQEDIIHLVSSFNTGVNFANKKQLKWAFTTSNASSSYFNDFSNIDDLQHLNWPAINATSWSACREDKQAEFLIENHFPFELIESIGVKSMNIQNEVQEILSATNYTPSVNVIPSWYY